MGNRITARQARAWSLGALSAPAAMALAGLCWTWVLLGGTLAACVLLAMGRLLRRTGCGLPAAFTLAFGRAGGTIAAGLELLWLLAASAGAASAVRLAFETNPGPMAPAVLLLLAALACGKGGRRAAAASGVLTLVLTLLYSIIVLTSLRHLRPDWCKPWGSAVDAGMSLCVGLSPACVLFASQPESERCGGGWGCAALAALAPTILALITAGCLSPELARVSKLPLYTLTKSLSVLSVMERFEPLLSVSLMLGLFLLLTAIICAAGDLMPLIGGAKQADRGTAAFCLAAFAGSLGADRVPAVFWATGAATFWGVLPVLTLVIVDIKKIKKF